MKHLASAASNIALIKYMGKIKNEKNKPTNRSFSYTLDHLRTFVEIELKDSNQAPGDQWEPLTQTVDAAKFYPLNLSQKGQERFLKHFQLLKNKWNVQNSFVVRSANNFPSDCGLASSASSFAALTVCAAELFEKMNPGVFKPDVVQLADLSRQGSGSSCRSLLTPWAIWDEDGIYAPTEVPYQKLHHQVVIVEDSQKQVSSSEAHLRVASSLLFQGRTDRAEQRLVDLLTAFESQNWNQAFQICWAEFWDMHALFETSQPAFSYMTDDSLFVLRTIQKIWNQLNDGPLVTMDAGANIHLLYRENQIELLARIEKELGERFKVISHAHPHA